jgi:replicative superfamily II helicase
MAEGTAWALARAFDSADNWLERYDIIITTNEKAVRFCGTAQNGWTASSVGNC